MLVDGKNEVGKFGRSHDIRSSTFVAVRAKRVSVNVAVLIHLHRRSPIPFRPTLPSAVSQIKDNRCTELGIMTKRLSAGTDAAN